MTATAAVGTVRSVTPGSSGAGNTQTQTHDAGRGNVSRPPNAEEIKQGFREPGSEAGQRGDWAGYQSDLYNIVDEAIKAQEERLKILAPKDEDGKPAPKTDPRMLKVEEGFVRKTIRNAINSRAIEMLVDSILVRYRGRFNPNPAPDPATARGSTPNPNPEKSRTPLSPQPAPSPVKPLTEGERLGNTDTERLGLADDRRASGERVVGAVRSVPASPRA